MKNFISTSKALRAQKKGTTNESPRRLISVLDPANAVSEAYRGLRTNLLYSRMDHPPKVIVFTSHGPGEGKSTTCANLGVVLAQAAKSVLILDCDFRKPVMQEFFELRNLHGMMDILSRERHLQEVWQEPMEGLKVVPVGPIPLNPSEVLGSQRFADFLDGVREKFDYVLIDSSPVGLVSDPAIVATQGDGVLLVFDAQNTRKTALRQSVRILQTVGANILGTVMNNADITKGRYTYYGEGYSYS